MRPRFGIRVFLLVAAIAFVGALFWVRLHPQSDPDDPLVEAQKGVEEITGMKLELDSGGRGGLAVEAVRTGGPAAAMGIEVGDRVLAIGDRSVWHVHGFDETMGEYLTSAPVLPLLVERDGEYRTVVLGGRRHAGGGAPPPAAPAAQEPASPAPEGP